VREVQRLQRRSQLAGVVVGRFLSEIVQGLERPDICHTDTQAQHMLVNSKSGMDQEFPLVTIAAPSGINLQRRYKRKGSSKMKKAVQK